MMWWTACLIVIIIPSLLGALSPLGMVQYGEVDCMSYCNNHTIIVGSAVPIRNGPIRCGGPHVLL